MAGEEVVGGVTGFLRLDNDQFMRAIAEALAAIKALDGKDVDIKIHADGADKIAPAARAAASGLDDMTASSRRLEDATSKVSVARARLIEVESTGKAKHSQILTAEQALTKALRDEQDQVFRSYDANIRLGKSHDNVRRSAFGAANGVDGLGKSLAGGGGGGLMSGPVIIGAIGAATALLGPVMGAATSAVGGFVGVVGGGILAWRGFSDEIEKGTALGLAVKGEIDGLSDALKGLQRTAAAASSAGVLAGLEHVRSWLPSVNDDVATLSKRLGSAFNISTQAFTSGLDNAMPLLQDGAIYAEKFAVWLRTAMQSQDFKDFVAYAQANLPAFIQMLTSLGEGFVALGKALAPVGAAIMSFFDLVGKGLGAVGTLVGWLRKLNEVTSIPSLDKTNTDVAALATNTDTATRAVQAFTPAVSAQAGALGTTTLALQAARDAQANTATAAADATLKMQLENNAAGLLKQALDGLNGTSLSAAQAQNTFDSALSNMGTHVGKTGKKVTFTTTSINNMSTASVALRGQLLGQVTAAEATAGAYGQMKGSAEAGRTKLAQLKEQIIKNAVAHGVDKAAVTAYIDTVLKVPKKVPPTLLQVNKAQALRDISTFQQRINAVHGKYVEIGVRYVVSGRMPNGSRSTAGGQVIDSANGNILHFASGGFSGSESHVAQIASAGTNRKWAEPETGGEAYIPLAKTKRPRSTQILAETNRLMGNPLGAGMVDLSAASIAALAQAVSRIRLAATISNSQFDTAAMSGAR